MPADNRGQSDPLRMVEIKCRARFPGARLDRWDGAFPCLLVRPPERDADTTAALVVGALGGAATNDAVGAFRAAAAEACAELECEDPEPILELVFADPRHHPSPQQRRSARADEIHLLTLHEFSRRGPLPPQRQMDLRGYLDGQSDRLEAESATRYETTRYIPQQYKLMELGDAGQVHDNLLENLLDWIASDDWYFVTLLSDAGKGKTFLLRELVRKLSERVPDVQPLLIRLTARRQIDDVGELVRLHLADNDGAGVDFSPEAFESDLRHGRIVLLLDGFDELEEHNTFDSAPSQLYPLKPLAQDRAKIVVSVRAQHLADDEPVIRRNGQGPARGGSWTVSIQDFEDRQIEELFRVSFPEGRSAERERLLRLATATPWLRGLAANPRMLGLIVDELRGPRSAEFEPKLKDAADRRPAALLKWLVERWLDGEEGRFRGTMMRSNLGRQDRLEGLTRLAERIWRHSGAYAAAAVEHEYLLEVATEILGLSATAAAAARDDFGVKEVAHALASSTLLVRRGQKWAFVHHSINEYLVAERIAGRLPRETVRRSGRAWIPPTEHDLPLHIRELLIMHRLSPLMVDVLCELNWRGAENWAAHTVRSVVEGETAKYNAARIEERLGDPGPRR